MSAYYPLSVNSLPDYLRQKGWFSTLFNASDVLQCTDLADGNLNLVFRVEGSSGRSLIVKQSLPYARKYPDFKLPLERACIEQTLLQNYAQHCPKYAPVVHDFDADMFVCVMEDLRPHVILRTGLRQGQSYPHLAQHLGDFLARSLFATSDLAVPSGVKKAHVAAVQNPVLMKAQEDVCFTQPLLEHSNNHCHPELMPLALELRADKALYAEVLRYKRLYMSSSEALLHGDLHTGSIMVSETDTRIIDPEFGFYGPMAYDLGCLLANLLVALVTQPAWHSDQALIVQQQTWLRQTLVDVWLVFEQRFRALATHEALAGEWQSALYVERYLQQLLQDSLGFAGVELLRRTIGLAHVPEWEAMADNPALLCAAEQCLKVARDWLLPAQAWMDMTSALARLSAHGG